MILLLCKRHCCTKEDHQINIFGLNEIKMKQHPINTLYFLHCFKIYLQDHDAKVNLKIDLDFSRFANLHKTARKKESSLNFPVHCIYHYHSLHCIGWSFSTMFNWILRNPIETQSFHLNFEMNSAPPIYFELWYFGK